MSTRIGACQACCLQAMWTLGTSSLTPAFDMLACVQAMLRTDANVQAFADCMLEMVHLLMPDQPVGLVRQLLIRSTTDMLQGNGTTVSFIRRVRSATGRTQEWSLVPEQRQLAACCNAACNAALSAVHGAALCVRLLAAASLIQEIVKTCSACIQSLGEVKAELCQPTDACAPSHPTLCAWCADAGAASGTVPGANAAPPPGHVLHQPVQAHGHLRQHGPAHRCLRLAGAHS